MATVNQTDFVVVQCVRCAVAYDHPNGHHARWCPGCSRDRTEI